MPRRRAHISTETKLAAALLALGLVPYSDAKAMGEANFLSLFAFDHNIRHAEDGCDEFWNLAPMLIPAHRIKTAKQDAPEMAHNRKVGTAAAIHKARLASKAGDYKGAAQILATAPKPPQPKRRIPARAKPWPAKGSRPLRSRPFERRAP